MVAHEEDSITHSSECKICNHKEREEIERMILANMSYREIVKEYPLLNPQNVSKHWNNQMKRPIHARSNAMLDEQSIARRDSLTELNDVFNRIDEQLDVLSRLMTRDGIEPDTVVRAMNSLRGLAATKISAIKTNIKLMGDGSEERNTINLTKAVQQIRKKMDEEEKKAEKIVEIKFTPRSATDE